MRFVWSTRYFSKLDMYGIKGKHFQWFHSNSTNRKSFVKYNSQNTNLKVLRSGVPQGSMLGPLLFSHICNLFKNLSKLLDPVMFVHNTNLFYTDKNIKSLFERVNKELHYVNEYFITSFLLTQEKLNLYFSTSKARVIAFHLS